MQKIGFVNALNPTLESSASSWLVIKIHVEMELHVFQSLGEMLFAFVHMGDLASSAVMVRTVCFIFLTTMFLSFTEVVVRNKLNTLKTKHCTWPLPHFHCSLPNAQSQAKNAWAEHLLCMLFHKTGRETEKSQNHRKGWKIPPRSSGPTIPLPISPAKPCP